MYKAPGGRGKAGTGPNTPRILLRDSRPVRKVVPPIKMIGSAIRRMANMLHRTEPTLAFSLYAFNHEMRLWKETNGDDWGAMVGERTSKQVYYLYFEAHDLTMAKLHTSP